MVTSPVDRRPLTYRCDSAERSLSRTETGTSLMSTVKEYIRTSIIKAGDMTVRNNVTLLRAMCSNSLRAMA